MKILLTGFERFGNLEFNPSEVIVKELSQHGKFSYSFEMIVEILPVNFTVAGDRIQDLIHKLRPQVVVCLGVSPGIASISLERLTLNLNDDTVKDNASKIKSTNPIIAEGPFGYWSTLPIDRMYKALKSQNIPVSISYDSGTYVCNHVFYLARHKIDLVGGTTKCGFIHVPLMSEQLIASTSHIDSLPLKVMVNAIENCIEIIIESFRKAHSDGSSISNSNDAIRF